MDKQLKHYRKVSTPMHVNGYEKQLCEIELLNKAGEPVVSMVCYSEEHQQRLAATLRSTTPLVAADACIKERMVFREPFPTFSQPGVIDQEVRCDCE